MLRSRTALYLTLLLLFPRHAGAQSGETVGTRAQGMGNAFVGVADDASAVYWNPAGLAGGSFLSLLLDGNTVSASPDDLALSGSRSAWLIAFSVPAVGLSYYRLHNSIATPSLSGAASFRLETLTTQHAGATVVHSVTDRLAVGATLKLVRGFAGIADVAADSAQDAVDNWDVAGQNSNKFDLDLGVMASGALGRLGLVVRNTTEPGFRTGSGRDLKLERQVRAGGSVLLLPNWKLAGDIDLTRTPGTFGERRELSVGTESQVTPRVAVRTGVRLNTTGDRGRAPALSVGGSFAVFGALLLDAQVTTGSDNAFRGWGLAGRMGF